LKGGAACYVINGILEGAENALVHNADRDHGGHTQTDAGHSHERLGLLELNVFEADVAEQVCEVHDACSPREISSDKAPSLSVMMRVP